MISSTVLPVEGELVRWAKLEGDPNKNNDTELWVHSLGEVGRPNMDNQAFITLSFDL